MLASAAGAALTLRVMRRDLGRLIGETTHLRSFDFSPSTNGGATFRDVQAASQSLEQAKTALRALGKYVPLDLVRDLYDARREPVLGAELQDVTLSSRTSPGSRRSLRRSRPSELAVALGAYLEAMTSAIHATGGIIDKYTGDGVMALWNTPRPLADHAARACDAAARLRGRNRRALRESTRGTAARALAYALRHPSRRGDRRPLPAPRSG